jgi:hypothetical protein
MLPHIPADTKYRGNNMATTPQSLPEKVACSICGKDLYPGKLLMEDSASRDLSNPEGFYCIDCWLRELRTKTIDSPLAKALDRVLPE